MYIPKHFEQPSIESTHEFVEAYPFATLVTLRPDGLCGDQIPMQLNKAPQPYGTLVGHVARANPVWQFADGKEVLVIFSGPNAYISPSWYASKSATGKVVPTWNYAVVHAHGKLRVFTDPQWLKSHLEELTDRHESNLTSPWSISDAPTEFIENLLDHIVGVEIVISRLEDKRKLSQNRPQADRERVIAGLRGSGSHDMAELVEKGGTNARS
ncbi:MAG: FMN-binding negative transcriptional regulator [Cellvibrionaceae bacterium]|nr:FMN-binding negative transcriptional regulator [Cellvibrionaceae bacterium]